MDNLPYAEALDLLKDLPLYTIDQALAADPSQEFGVDMTVIHIFSRKVEVDMGPSQRYQDKQKQAKKQKLGVQNGAAMILAVDRNGEGAVCCWENEADFGTLSLRVHGGMQPGQTYVFYPARFGKVWKNAGTEVVTMGRGEAPISLNFYMKNFQVWDHHKDALKPDLVTHQKAELHAVCLEELTVESLEVMETAYYRACGNIGCEALAEIDGNCTTCVGEGVRSCTLVRWVLVCRMRSAKKISVQMAGRRALGVLDRKFLAPNVNLPNRLTLNKLIVARFVGKQMHTMGWARNVLSDVGIVSEVSEVHCTLFKILGEPEPEVEAPPVGLTLRAQYTDDAFRAFDVTNTTPPESDCVGLMNLGGCCPTNSLLQAFAATPPLMQEIIALSVLDVGVEKRDVVENLQHCLNKMELKLPPTKSKHRALDTAIKALLTPEERRDQWGNAVTFTRTISQALSLFSSEMQVTRDVCCTQCDNRRLVPDAEVTTVLELHAVNGDELEEQNLSGMIDAVLDEKRDQMCQDCKENVSHTVKSTFRHLGTVLAMAVNYPPESRQENGGLAPCMHAFEIPGDMNFAQQNWEPTAVLEYNGHSHWWAYVKRSTSVYRCNDANITCLNESTFPRCHAALIFFTKKES